MPCIYPESDSLTKEKHNDTKIAFSDKHPTLTVSFASETNGQRKLNSEKIILLKLKMHYAKCGI
jgi:hypothetical protein